MIFCFIPLSVSQDSELGKVQAAVRGSHSSVGQENRVLCVTLFGTSTYTHMQSGAFGSLQFAKAFALQVYPGTTTMQSHAAPSTTMGD